MLFDGCLSLQVFLAFQTDPAGTQLAQRILSVARASTKPLDGARKTGSAGVRTSIPGVTHARHNQLRILAPIPATRVRSADPPTEQVQPPVAAPTAA